MVKQDSTKEKTETEEVEETTENPDENDSDGGKTREKEPSFWSGLFTPEGIIMFTLAVIVDVLEIVLDLTGVGALVALALDIGAFIIIGGWMMSRGSDVKVSQRASETLKKGAQQVSAKIAKATKVAKVAQSAKSAKWAKRLKWARTAMPIFELIPFISIVPMWIVGVYFELKYGGK